MAKRIVKRKRAGRVIDAGVYPNGGGWITLDWESYVTHTRTRRVIQVCRARARQEMLSG